MIGTSNMKNNHLPVFFSSKLNPVFVSQPQIVCDSKSRVEGKHHSKETF